jgi:hypothetical protein
MVAVWPVRSEQQRRLRGNAGWSRQRLIFVDDTHIGSIGVRSGVPVHAEQWQWTVSVYPASHRGIRDGGLAADFQTARAAFDQAWQKIETQITEADRQGYRRERALRVWKYRMWDSGCGDHATRDAFLNNRRRVVR